MFKILFVELCVCVLQTYDNGDSQLDSKEFLGFLKHNETALNLTYSNTVETNLLLRCELTISYVYMTKQNKKSGYSVNKSSIKFSLSLSLRSLCVDALIELSDENADWKLSLTEFINCLTPTYHPPERSNNTHMQKHNLLYHQCP